MDAGPPAIVTRSAPRTEKVGRSAERTP